MTGLELPSAEVAALHRRTEGWIAGLQLAALSLQGVDDVRQFVRSFAGSHRYVLDYLMDEVFRRQPADVQEFLLQTSILDSLSAPLCDAVRFGFPETHGDSRRVLLALEQANLFLVPLDESRQWYRYHHLFADLLRHRFRVEGRQDAAELHQRASRWYAGNGRAEDAVRHALAAAEWEDAASLIVQVAGDVLKRGEVVTLLGWFHSLPESVVQSSPRICLEYCWPLILTEQIDAAESCLAQAENAIRERDSGLFQGEIAMARAYIARARGDGARAMELSQQALSLLPHDDLASRGIVAVNLGMTQWYRGALSAAEEALLEARRAGRGTGNEYVGWAATVFLTKIERARGKLRHAAESCRRFIRQESRSPLACLAHYDLGRLLYEWNDLAAAADHLEQGIELARRSGSVEFEFGGCSALAVVRQAQGESSAVQAALETADRLAAYPDIPPPTRMQNLVCQVNVALGQGDLDTAARLVEGFPASPQAAGSFPDHLELILARARLLLAHGQGEAAAESLATAYSMARQAGWEYVAVQSAALWSVAAPTPQQARALLAEVLALAEPEGYVRTFVDAGGPMTALLREAATRGVSVEYAGKLLVAFNSSAEGAVVTRPHAGASTLIEALSDRETEVLHLLADGLTYQEIAQALYLSVNTVKTHVRNIYGKLGVTRRRAATAKARELGLLP
jgi:LuxR family maltose regulon positive regulatory protein